MTQASSLPPTWIVGFTGHRRLNNAEKVGATLRQLLSSLAAEVPGKLVGHSSIAIGGDTLFAEACVALEIPWIALLPVAKDDFRRDFTEADWTKAQVLLQRAARLESLPTAADRNLAYLECGLCSVEEADVMIAVWNGEPSAGTGGTADVVAHARALGKPLIVIHPEHLSIEREGFTPGLFSDPEMDYLNQLPESGGPIEESDSHGRVVRFFQKVDAEAARIAPSFRRWVAASVIMNTLAAILVTVAIGFDIESPFLDGAVFFLLGGAVLSIVRIKLRRAHRRWIRCRVSAEICRSSLATWHLGNVSAPVWYSHLEDFGRLAKSIRLVQMYTKHPPMSFAECRENYLAYRISGQARYFERRSSRLAFMLAALTIGFWTFSVLGLGRTLFTAFSSHSNNPNLVVSFLPMVLPLAAGCAMSPHLYFRSRPAAGKRPQHGTGFAGSTPPDREVSKSLQPPPRRGKD